MKLFSFVAWVVWAAIGVRVLLAPFWMPTVGEAMILLLVVAPGVGLVSVAMSWLTERSDRVEPRPS